LQLKQRTRSVPVIDLTQVLQHCEAATARVCARNSKGIST
jgi:hypothetical protein